MIPHLLKELDLDDHCWQQHLCSIRETSSLESMVWASWLLALALAKKLIEQELARRAQLPTSWTNCTKCGTRLHSKGMRPRQIQTLVGVVHWQRRVGRCPKGCRESQVIPLDNALGQRLMLEALRQEWQKAKTLVWISDGGKGFWRLYHQCFSQTAIAVLDFYHAAQNLWKAAAACLDGRTKKARQWFKVVRHQLRHGQSEQVIAQLAYAIDFRKFPTSVLNTLTNVHNYLQTHQKHIKYQQFKELGLPLGSGMVESACKWLIQQRFKGVGMRWSENGFNSLLHLRLTWVNGRFDQLFSSELASPNR